MPGATSHFLVTGASAGLGASLARRLARPGIELTLVARRIDSLVQVAETCRARGATVEIRPCDVSDRAACAARFGDLHE